MERHACWEHEAQPVRDSGSSATQTDGGARRARRRGGDGEERELSTVQSGVASVQHAGRSPMSAPRRTYYPARRSLSSKCIGNLVGSCLTQVHREPRRLVPDAVLRHPAARLWPSTGEKAGRRGSGRPCRQPRGGDCPPWLGFREDPRRGGPASSPSRTPRRSGAKYEICDPLQSHSEVPSLCARPSPSPPARLTTGAPSPESDSLDFRLCV